MKYNRFIILLATFVCTLPSLADRRVEGTVIDGVFPDEALMGASVKVPSTNIGTITDMDGHFELMVPDNAKVVEISFVGYQTVMVNCQSDAPIRITLKEDVAQMDELVVIGYGTMKKSDLTGTVAQVKGDELVTAGQVDLTRSLQGKMAGVEVQQSDGTPGGGMSITVRGANSFSTTTQPLYVIDGVPYESGTTPANGIGEGNTSSNPLANINPHDIESMEVLKDASATAIYGSRGANGVVLITTKRGKTGKVNVEVSANFGVQQVTKKMPMLSAPDYARYVNEQYDNDRYYMGLSSDRVPYSGTWGHPYVDGVMLTTGGVYTGSPEDYENPGEHVDEHGCRTMLGASDWQDEIFRTAFTQDYNISVSGGSDKGWYLISGNYANQQGIIRNSGYERYSVRANLGIHATRWLEIGTNTSFTVSTTNFANTLDYNTSVIRSALIFPVTYGPDMDTQEQDELNWLASNPAAYVRTTKDQLKGISVFSSSYVELTFTPYLKFRQNLGIGYNDNHRGSYVGRHTYEGRVPTAGKASRSTGIWRSLSGESILTYDQRFGSDHHINVMGAFSIEEGAWDNFSQTYWGFPDDETQDNNMERALYSGTPTSDNGKQRLLSFLARANYTLMDRYLFTASVRTDGSSKFLSRNKWATFLSGAFAWRMSEEPWLKPLGIFDNFKWRVSYGETGNQGIGSYRTLSFMDVANYPFGGATASGMAMVTWRGPVDEDLRWETTAQVNAGVDIAVLNGRLSLTADYYFKKTRDLLQAVQIPSSTGFTNMLTNKGHVINQGLELTLSGKPIATKDWHWSVDVTFSLNRNRIGGLDGDQFATALWSGVDNVFIQRNGLPIGAVYGYVEDGFYNNLSEVRADPQYVNATDAVALSMVGEIRYRDVNKDGLINEQDRVVIGDVNPVFSGALATELRWRDLSLKISFVGSYGNDIVNGNLMDIKLANQGNITYDAYLTRWTPSNYENAQWPKATSGYQRTYRFSNRYIEDASYLRMKDLSLSYNLRQPFRGMDHILFGFTVTNVFTLSKYSGYDPNVNAFGGDSSRRGVDVYAYPLSRTFAFSITCAF